MAVLDVILNLFIYTKSVLLSGIINIILIKNYRIEYNFCRIIVYENLK